jgi:hypothetical protein
LVELQVATIQVHEESRRITLHDLTVNFWHPILIRALNTTVAVNKFESARVVRNWKIDDGWRNPHIISIRVIEHGLENGICHIGGCDSIVHHGDSESVFG